MFVIHVGFFFSTESLSQQKNQQLFNFSVVLGAYIRYSIQFYEVQMSFVKVKKCIGKWYFEQHAWKDTWSSKLQFSLLGDVLQTFIYYIASFFCFMTCYTDDCCYHGKVWFWCGIYVSCWHCVNFTFIYFSNCGFMDYSFILLC